MASRNAKTKAKPKLRLKSVKFMSKTEKKNNPKQPFNALAPDNSVLANRLEFIFRNQDRKMQRQSRTDFLTHVPRGSHSAAERHARRMRSWR
jgi:hypothetical protein